MDPTLVASSQDNLLLAKALGSCFAVPDYLVMPDKI